MILVLILDVFHTSVGLGLDSVETVLEERTLSKISVILSNKSHLLNSVFSRQRSSVRSKLLSLSCSTERLKNSFVPRAVRPLQGGAGVES